MFCNYIWFLKASAILEFTSNRITKSHCEDLTIKMGWKAFWFSPPYCPTQLFPYSCPQQASLQKDPRGWVQHEASRGQPWSQGQFHISGSGNKKERRLKKDFSVWKQSQRMIPGFGTTKALRGCHIGTYTVFRKMHMALTYCLNVHTYVPGMMRHFFLSW